MNMLLRRPIVFSLVGAATLVAQSQDDSYISHPSEKKVLFESQIAPSYELVLVGKDPAKMKKGFSLQAVVTPKILLKMYADQSRPVKTPSYMPQLTVRAAWKGDLVGFYPFLTLAHHSNGQSGDTYEPGDDSTLSVVNTETGNFATNYIKIGYAISAGPWPNHRLGVAYEHHPVHGWWFQIDNVIKDSYGRKRLHFFYEYAGKNMQVDVKYTRIYDAWSLPDGVSPNIVEATARWRVPVFRNMVWLFATYYQGQDYYNIHFNEQLEQFKMGVAIRTKLIQL